MLLVGAGGFATIQAAIDAASDGDTIMVAAGIYDEDLNINKAVTILGAHAGDAVAGRNPADLRVGETTIIGHAHITASDAVTIDGVRFLNDATTTGGGPSNPTLFIGTGFDHVITNSIFYSTVQGGTADDRAIMLPRLGGGDITISNNLITGSQAGLFGTASWGRGIWSDGGGTTLVVDVTGNTIEFSRTGINADMGGIRTLNDRPAIPSIPTAPQSPVASTLMVWRFRQYRPERRRRVQLPQLDERRQLRCRSGDGHAAAAYPANLNNDAVVILGGSGTDTLKGTDGVDYIDGNNHPTHGANTDADNIDGRGGNDFLFGRGGNDTINAGTGNDTVNGGDGNDTIDGGADNDTIDGGAGDDTITGGEGNDAVDGGADNDTAVYAESFGSLSITKAGATYTILNGVNIDTSPTSRTSSSTATP